MSAYPNWITNNPYRPPNDTVGSKTAEEICLEVGRLTTTWERVENALSLLFGIQFNKPTPAARAYGAIIGSAARCDMIEASYEADGKLTDLLKAHIGVVRRAGALRNIVAHGMIVQDSEPNWWGEADCMDTEGPFFITPALYNTAKTLDLGTPKIVYNAATVAKIREFIASLIQPTFGFVDPKLAAKPVQYMVTKTSRAKLRKEPGKRSQ